MSKSLKFRPEQYTQMYKVNGVYVRNIENQEERRIAKTIGATPEECDQISALVSAAPELLEALQNLWQDTKENSGLDLSDLEYLNTKYNIQAVIDKATGV